MRYPHINPIPCIFSFCFCLLYLLAFSVRVAFAGGLSVDITGQFNDADNRFTGKAVFSYPSSSKCGLLFHLPPNMHAAEDTRTVYNLRRSGGKTESVLRKDLASILPADHENIHLAKAIRVTAVTVDGQETPYLLRDNPDLPPSVSSGDTLLEVSPGHHQHPSATVSIDFSTTFQDLPEGYKRFLWDFIPRPVGCSESGPDFRGSSLPDMVQQIKIDRRSAGGGSRGVVAGRFAAPVTGILLDDFDFQNNNLDVSFDSYLEESEIHLISRIIHVSEFLEHHHAFKQRREKLKLVFWDGETAVSGMTVLLPRKLFRYPIIFYKQFEIELLNSIVRTLMQNQYDIDRVLYPWMIPAVQAEVSRRYFQERFNGNTFLFPWLDWINPEYFSDTTVRPWIENLNEKEVSGADIPSDLAYYAHIHHPGYQKGSHLLWMLHDGRRDFRDRLIDRIFSVLNSPTPAKRFRLTPDRFFKVFAASDAVRNIGGKWLSAEGRVDYVLENVSIVEEFGRYQARFQVRNLGTLSPRLEVGFYFDGTEKKIIEIDGPGDYTLTFEREPRQIILDPAFSILDDNPVNNRWRLPLRTRLIWDFAPPDVWLFTISPLVGEGNTFDRNILGLNLMAAYMSRTIFQLNFWKGGDSDLLWSGEFQHLGFPGIGSLLYLKTGYLGAVNSTSIGLEQSIFKGFPTLLIDTELWIEELDDMDDDAFSEDETDWAGVNIESEFLLWQHAFHNWQVNLTARSGYSLFSPRSEYQQLCLDQNLRYSFGIPDIHLGYKHGFSSGTVPLQHRYPMGGTEGLAGFPRDTELLFHENRIMELGVTLPPFLTHTDINLLGLMWLNRVIPTLDFHYGQGISEDSEIEEFRDIELSLSIEGEFINRYYAKGRFGVAQPIGDEKYKDFRIVFFSDWVF
jgi:hypothetical protein